MCWCEAVAYDRDATANRCPSVEDLLRLDLRTWRDQTLKVKLPIDKHGYPVLPNWETIDRRGLIYKKMVIGQFMSEMYGIAAGGGKRRVPWAKLHEAQGDWIAAEYLPEGVTLMQYHHIHLDDANSLLKHWIQRQTTGEIPFHFKKVDKADRHHDGLTLTRVPMASSLVENCRHWKMREFCPHTHPTPRLCPLTLALSLALSHSATLTPAVQGRVLPRNAPLTTNALKLMASHPGSCQYPPLQAPEIDRRLGNAQHVTQRSEHTMRPTEWAKQTQGGSMPARTKARR
ncbi:hypothetical protein EDB83DRAFT_2309383 [Lactarius deliciosus]|nr:hypothetical protein EDB83DRAFT_2309383 [Lactarius deliciosus]